MMNEETKPMRALKHIFSSFFILHSSFAFA
jgi:hypothetical protein